MPVLVYRWSYGPCHIARIVINYRLQLQHLYNLTSFITTIVLYIITASAVKLHLFESNRTKWMMVERNQIGIFLVAALFFFHVRAGKNKDQPFLTLDS